MSCEGPYCGDCPQREIGIRRLTTDGLGVNKVLIAGDSPWDHEIRQGRPFAGPSGALLDRQFARLGLSREQFLITNAALSCKPPHLGWTDHPERYPEAAIAINHCRPYFNELVEKFQPRVILTLGNVALLRVCGVTGLDDRHSYYHVAPPYGVPVIPTYHPSFILQGHQKYASVLMFAIQRAVELAEGKWQPTQLDLLLDPPYEVAARYLAGPLEELMCDIETPESGGLDEEEAEQDASYTIIRCGISTQAGSALTVPWAPPYIDLVLSALRSARRVLFWNRNYDVPRLRAAGCSIPGQILDAMWAWHWLQSDLPKKLGFVAPFYYSGAPWKHLSSAQPAFYNACDAAIQQIVWQGVKRDIEQQGRWEGFERHCLAVEPILLAVGERGITIDTAAREKFMGRLQAEYAAAHVALQAAVPDMLKPRKLYKRQPKDMANVIELPPATEEAALLAGAAELLKKLGKPRAARRAKKGACA